MVRTPQADVLATALLASGHSPRFAADGLIEVPGVSPETVGRIAAQEGVVVLELTEQRNDLEGTFRQLTTQAQEISI